MRIEDCESRSTFWLLDIIDGIFCFLAYRLVWYLFSALQFYCPPSALVRLFARLFVTITSFGEIWPCSSVFAASIRLRNSSSVSALAPLEELMAEMLMGFLLDLSYEWKEGVQVIGLRCNSSVSQQQLSRMFPYHCSM